MKRPEGFNIQDLLAVAGNQTKNRRASGGSYFT
jgi:hypothetical protein